MESDARLLLLEGEPRRGEGRLAGGLERKRVLAVLAEAGARVHHDSGGRLLVIEVSAEVDEILRRELRGIKLLPLTEGIEHLVGDVDQQDALFARALAIRLSPEYRGLKSRQKPGETPEERLLVTGPCTPPEG